ncbi:MAG: cytochrome C [Desulfobacteraceae bacterium]|nr:cytochrome C [Desulfobacterales bacterium]MBL6967068.1 cytochrome C [Desulfobacteraceae bacterium]MBL7102475.1 cytochrome C [Desulfobacteraceae bacterium]MBL7173079.1 cytochrome C [Desulfobacteraceae bacterium]MBU0736314.1 cytochrome C [Pseudomonadota bacterium]
MVSVLVAISFSIQAGEFTQEDLKRWDKEFMTVVMKGEKLFHSALGKNKVSCDQCHPNGANTHPETYPKFQQQIGRVVALFEMVNWCIQNPLEGDPLPPEDPKMTALLSYMTYERRGVPLAPGKH